MHRSMALLKEQNTALSYSRFSSVLAPESVRFSDNTPYRHGHTLNSIFRGDPFFSSPYVLRNSLRNKIRINDCVLTSLLRSTYETRQGVSVNESGMRGCRAQSAMHESVVSSSSLMRTEGIGGFTILPKVRVLLALRSHTIMKLAAFEAYE
jgi:hypothetical protein